MAILGCHYNTNKALSKDKICNEDNAKFFEDKGVFFFLMGDGQGSKTNLERASNIAIQEFIEMIKRSNFNDINSLADEVARAYYAVNRTFKLFRSLEGEKLGQLATGLTMIAITQNNELLVAHTGNVRVWLVRNGQARSLTSDHTKAYEEYKQGKITYEEIAEHNERTILNRYLGQSDDNIICDLVKGQLKQNDLIMIATDGVYFSVSTEEMLYLLNESEGNLENACNMVVELAGERQMYDDRSVGLIIVD